MSSLRQKTKHTYIVGLCKFLCVTHGCVFCLLLFLVCMPPGGHVCAAPTAGAAEPGRIHMHHKDVAYSQLQEWNPADFCEFSSRIQFGPFQKIWNDFNCFVWTKGSFKKTLGFLKSCFPFVHTRHHLITWQMIFLNIKSSKVVCSACWKTLSEFALSFLFMRLHFQSTPHWRKKKAVSLCCSKRNKCCTACTF